MFSFLKKGATVVIRQVAKVAITPTTSELPHQPSIGKMVSNILPNRPKEKLFDLKMHDRTYKKLGIELPSSTRAPGHQDEVSLRVPSYKLPLETLQKFATWQEQGKEGDVEETKIGVAESILKPLSTAEEKLNRKHTDKYFNQLKELDKKLQKMGGKIIVESTQGSYTQSLTIEIDVSGKSPEEIQEQVRFVLNGLDIHDEKLVKTFSERLYKSSIDPKVTSADIQEKKNTKTSTNKQEKVEPKPESEPPVESHDGKDDSILSSDFSLTNPCSMPYSRTPAQSADMLLEQQSKTLMQQKPEPRSNTISDEVQREIDQIAQGLSQDVQIDDQDQGQGMGSNKRAQTTTGKVHARR